MQAIKNNSIGQAIFGIYRLLIISAFILAMYFAQTILIPLSIAALLTFLLSPLVEILEKWIGRIPSILLAAIVVFSIIGLTGYIFIRQLVLFGSNFPSYYEIIQTKFEAFHLPQNKLFSLIGHLIGNLKDDLFGGPNSLEGVTPPLGLRLIDLSSNFLAFVESFFGSFFSILAISAIVVLLVIFMLLNKEDIQGRIIKLIGQSSISSTTSAMNDANERVFRYLYRLFFVNLGFGICVAIGLYLIGIPNAILWGFFAAILRFIPYIGIWIATIIPIALSFIITDTWIAPLITISFFIILEMVTAYIIEPFYYGTGTGVSSFALIVAVIFWTWLWGPIGLLLSTPLTVCLVVLGQYAPNMNFLSVLLSQEKALTPAEECYHRLLSNDTSEAMDIIEAYLQKNSLVSAYDSLLIPVIVQIERDFHSDLIDSEQKESLYQSIREIIEFLDNNQQKEQNSISEEKGSIVCLSTQAIRDEIGISILAQLLLLESFNIFYATKLNSNETFELIDNKNPEAICIVAIAPFVISKIRFLCAKFHQHKPKLPIIICLLGFPEISPEIFDKLNSAGAASVVTSTSHTIQAIKNLKKQQ